MFLATSALREFWDEADELLLLGPWCLRAGERLGPRQTLVACPWDDRARLTDDIALCEEISDRLVERLADHLNSAQGLSLSRRYWRFLIGPWAFFYTHQCFILYSRISLALKQHPGLQSRLLSETDFYVPRDTSDYVRFFQTERFNLQLASHLLRGLGKGFPEKPLPVSATEPPASLWGIKEALREVLAVANEWARRRAPCDVLSDELYPMGRHIWRLMLARRGRLWPVRAALPPALQRPPVFDDRRRGLAALALAGEFGRLLAISLPRALPTLYLEGFAQAREHVRSRLGYKTKLILAGSHLHYDDFFKLTVAEHAQNGVRVLGFQHGGAYGHTKAPIAEAHERKVTDGFITWGWSGTDSDPRLRDAPVPHLSQRARRGEPRWRNNRGILYASTAGLKSPHHLFYSPSEQQWEQFFAERDRFLRALPERLRPQLALRLHPKDFGWGQRESLRAGFPGLRLDSNAVPYIERLTQVRIAVTDHPTTAFLESLAVGAPSIHFWDWSRWELRPEAERRFQALGDAGIVWRDPESAARQLAEVYDDPAPWWESPRVRRAREEFVACYARVDTDWVAAWSRLIDAELA